MRHLFVRLTDLLSALRAPSSEARLPRDFGSSVEPLESRIAPAAVASFSKGTLLIQGNPESGLVIEQITEMVGTDTVITTKVTDGQEALTGTSSFSGVKNIVVKLDPKATDENQVTLKLLKLGGSVEVLAPAGGTTNLAIYGMASGDASATVGKSILLKGRGGNESLSISGIDIGGGVVFAAGKGTASVYIGGDVSTGSNVAFVGVNSITVDPGAELGGNLLITQKSSATDFFVLSAGAKIEGNVVIFAGSGSTTINAYAEVGGRFFANAGAGPNAFNVSLSAKALQYVGGGDYDTVSLFRSQIAGSAEFVLSGGKNEIFFDRGGTLALFGDFTVGKNLTVAGGSSSDVVRLDSNSNNVNVAGKSRILLGDGDNVFGWNGVSTGNSIQISSGRGTDVISVFGLEASSATLNVNLGGGADRLAISNTFRKASLNGGEGNDEITNGSVLPEDTKIKAFEVGV